MWVCSTILERAKGLTVFRLATYLSSYWTSEQTWTYTNPQKFVIPSRASLRLIINKYMRNCFYFLFRLYLTVIERLPLCVPVAAKHTRTFKLSVLCLKVLDEFSFSAACVGVGRLSPKLPNSPVSSEFYV
jgi:hypothetical protein